MFASVDHWRSRWGWRRRWGAYWRQRVSWQDSAPSLSVNTKTKMFVVSCASLPSRQCTVTRIPWRVTSAPSERFTRRACRVGGSVVVKCGFVTQNFSPLGRSWDFPAPSLRVNSHIVQQTKPKPIQFIPRSASVPAGFRTVARPPWRITSAPSEYCTTWARRGGGRVVM